MLTTKWETYYIYDKHRGNRKVDQWQHGWRGHKLDWDGDEGRYPNIDQQHVQIVFSISINKAAREVIIELHIRPIFHRVGVEMMAVMTTDQMQQAVQAHGYLLSVGKMVWKSRGIVSFG